MEEDKATELVGARVDCELRMLREVSPISDYLLCLPPSPSVKNHGEGGQHEQEWLSNTAENDYEIFALAEETRKITS